MGYSCTSLIPAAILFDNPGITREEYVELLNQTHCTWIAEYSAEEPWDFTEKRREDDLVQSNHRGLHGLGYILGLKETEKYKQVVKSTRDSNGILIPSPDLWVCPREGNRNWLAPEYEVTVYSETKIFPEKEEHSLSWNKLEIGDIWEETMIGQERGIVTDILFERYTYKEKDSEDNFDDFRGPEYYYVMRIKPFEVYVRKIKFEDLESLSKEFPQFNPDFIYDFSQKKGFIRGGLENDQDFLWTQRNKKYYLDLETLNRILPGGMARWGGYSGLVATAEAIRKKAWKLLSYRGDKHLQQFLNDFPDSRGRYEGAVIDSQLSLSAKLQKMTHTELLRYRMLPPNSI